MNTKIAILGLNQIGASIGLALGQMKDQVTRHGNDRDPGIARQAEKSGAVDKVFFTIPSAVKDADLIILALPVDEIRMTMEAIAPELKPGVVVMDTSPVKEMGMQWSKELFPGPDRYFISVVLSRNADLLLESGVEAGKARADFFKNGLMHITSMPGVDESALELTTNLARIMGATPLFADITEMDGLIASTRMLPKIISSALVNSTTSQPGWQEARKVADQAYAMGTEMALSPDEAVELGQAMLLNSENVTRVIDQFMLELQDLREYIADKNADELKKYLLKAQANRNTWWGQRASNNWEAKASRDIPLPTGGEILGRLIGIRPKKN